MKRVAFVLLLILSLLLVACGDDSVTVSGGNTTAPATTTAPTTNTVSTAPTSTFAPPAPATTIAPIKVTTPPTTQTAPPATTQLPLTPDNGLYTGRIVYSNERTSEIITAGPDGGKPVKIANGYQPHFSPDGQRIVYFGYASNNKADDGKFFSIKLDGTDRQELCPLNTELGVNIIRWSPTGRYIALYTVRASRVAVDTYLCEVATRQIKLIKAKQGSIYQIYEWLGEDGKNALFQAAPDGKNYDLYYGATDSYGSDAVNLTNGQNRATLKTDQGQQQIYYDAKFSPDGKTIAVAGDKGIFFLSVSGQKSPLEGKSLDTGGRVPNHIAWSPNGAGIMVLHLNGGTPTLRLYDVKTGTAKEIATEIGSFDWSGKAATVPAAPATTPAASGVITRKPQSLWKAEADFKTFRQINGFGTDKAGNVYVLELYEGVNVAKFSTDGQVLVKMTLKLPNNQPFYDPAMQMTIDPSGNIYILDATNFKVYKFDTKGKYLLSFGSKGKGDGQFVSATVISTDLKGNVFVLEQFNDRTPDSQARVQVFDPQGKFLTKFGSTGTGAGQFTSAYTVIADNQGIIYVTESGGRLLRFDANNGYKYLSEFVPQDKNADLTTLNLDPQNNLLFYDHSQNQVKKFDKSGKLLEVIAPVADLGATDLQGNYYLINAGEKPSIEKLKF